MNFCSRAALETAQPIAGTGVRAQAYVLAPVPKRFWTRDEINAGWASEEEMSAIREAREGGVVTRLYNPTTEDAAALVYVGEWRPPQLQPLLGAFMSRWWIGERPSPRLAICTHGTRDRCCAKWGFAVYREALRLYENGKSVFEPLECSHLGGDRFAATGVFLPSGSMYAHMDALDLEALTAAEAAGSLLPEHYRGRVFDEELTQVVRAGLARDGIVSEAAGAIALLERRRDSVRVAIDGGERVFSIRLGTAETRFFASCASMDRERRSRGQRITYEGATAETA